MSVTRRLILLEALGFLLLIPAALLGIGIAFFCGWNILCAGLYACDIFITPKKNALQIERVGNEILYFKAENTVELSVRNMFHRALAVELKDHVPDLHFAVNPSGMKQSVPANSEQKFTYILTPNKRGAFAFPRVFVRYTGVLGLCVKSFAQALPIEYKVYPNVKDLSKYRLMLRRSAGDGVKRVPTRGVGVEFESLRAYVDGDDYRTVNWPATARENKLLVNQYEIEKDQPVMVLLDAGRPLSYTVNGHKKLDFAINAALALSDIVMQSGDKAGLVVFDADVKSFVPPGKGERQRSLLMETLYHVESVKYTSDYQAALFYAAGRQSRRATMFLFTDFQTLDEANEMIESLGILAKRHSPIVVLMKNESIEKKASSTPSEKRDAYEKAVAIDLLAERAKIMRALKARGIPCVESDAENFASAAVNRYLRNKSAVQRLL